MEEKEPIKVKLSTVLLIIAVIVILVLGVIIGFLYKQNITKNNSTPNTEKILLGENAISKMEDVEKNDIDEQKNKENDDSSDNTSTIAINESKTETSKTDYSKYFGTWSDGSENEFTVRNIGNDLITFTWFVYRTASIEDVTLPFKDNKAVFYYHGFDDKNFNSKNEDDEFYCRKATVELKENSISIKVENSTLAESNKNISLDKTDLFGGGVYIKPGQYNFTTKK